MILIDALTFFVAFFIIAFLKVDEGKEKDGLTFSTAVKDLGEAYTFVRNEPIIFVIILCGALTNLAFTPLNVTSIIYVQDILKMGPEGMSLFSACISVGAIAGGWYMGKKAAKLDLVETFSVGLIVAGITYFVMGVPAFVAMASWLRIAILLDIFVLSFFVSLVNTILSPYFIQSVPETMLGRVFGLLSMLFMITTPIGSILSGTAQFISVPTLIMLASGLIFLSALFLRRFVKKRKL